jgi:anti-sigma factor RsiW
MKISRKDWSLLSAYVDDELSVKMRSRLESRLEDQPELRAALEDLRVAKDILSSAPRRTVPRNFTLTADMVGSPRRRSPVRNYRLAAAVLSFLFIALVFIDLSGSLFMGSLPSAMSPRSEEIMLEALPEEAAEAEFLEDAVDEPSPLTAEDAVESEPPIGEAAAPEAEVQQESESLAAEEAGQDAEQQETQSKTASEEEDRAVDNQVDEGGVDQALPTEVIQGEEYYLPSQEMDELPPNPSSVSWLRVLEIILGLGALIFAGAAWYRHKS